MYIYIMYIAGIHRQKVYIFQVSEPLVRGKEYWTKTKHSSILMKLVKTVTESES